MDTLKHYAAAIGRATWTATKWTTRAIFHALMFVLHVFQWVIPIFGLLMWRFRVSKRRHREVIAASRKP